ncbi:zeta toxin family protein [Nocardiopsis sp. CNT-189]|uniref:zeta toxin family protein n=1 Tax=Nocardiopsis oceanisediminis TaxID=2816862 RepID=UPI003B2BACA7
MTDDSYEVDEGDFQRLFDEYIEKGLFQKITPVQSGRPTAVMLGGQLAAGKTTALRHIAERYGGDIARVSPDDFRKLHPHRHRIMRERPHDYVALTSPAMYRWNEMTQEYAHEHGYNLVIEGTLRSPEWVVHDIGKLARRPESGRHEGFRAEVVGLAVSEYRSRLDMVGRYVGRPPGKGRWADAAGHDEIYRGLPGTLDALEADPNVWKVIVTDRDGTVHYENTRGPDGRWEHEPRAGAALKEARGEGEVPFGREEAREWLESYWEHSEALMDRGELNPTTAPTMLALHSDADRVAQVAYADAPEALTRHGHRQALQKAVFQAGGRGVDNSELPHTPEEFFQADRKERGAFLKAMGAAPAPAEQGRSDPAAQEAVRRAQQGMGSPMQKGPAPGRGRPRGRQDPGPGVER